MRFNKTDPQRYRAYDWEKKLFYWAGPTASARTLRKTVERCCRLYRVPAPTVKVVTKNKRNGKKLTSYSIYEYGLIVIRPRHRYITDAIHEAAHFICDHLIVKKQADHSPEWLSIHLNLMHRLKILPLNVLKYSAAARGLQWVTVSKTSPESIRKFYLRRKPK